MAIFTIAISPTSATVFYNHTQQFTATVTGITNPSLLWGVEHGTIDSNGLYSPPLFYYSNSAMHTGVYRIDENGGHRELIPGTSPSDSLLLRAALSPDGKILALFTSVLKPQAKSYSRRIIFVGAGATIRNIDLDPGLSPVFASLGPPSSAAFHFTPDGKSLAFVVEEDGVDDIWIQPIDGSKGRKLTNFHNSQTILDFRWSPNGKSLGLLRFNSVSDVVLLRNTSNTSRGSP